MSSSQTIPSVVTSTIFTISGNGSESAEAVGLKVRSISADKLHPWAEVLQGQLK